MFQYNDIALQCIINCYGITHIPLVIILFVMPYKSRIESQRRFSFVQDRFEYGLADKQNAIEKSLEDAETVANKNDVFINFASTKGSLPVGHSYFFAKKMNERFLQSELEDKYFGRLIFDYATSAVASKVIETNF